MIRRTIGAIRNTQECRFHPCTWSGGQEGLCTANPCVQAVRQEPCTVTHEQQEICLHTEWMRAPVGSDTRAGNHVAVTCLDSHIAVGTVVDLRVDINPVDIIEEIVPRKVPWEKGDAHIRRTSRLTKTYTSHLHLWCIHLPHRQRACMCTGPMHLCVGRGMSCTTSCKAERKVRFLGAARIGRT